MPGRSRSRATTAPRSRSRNPLRPKACSNIWGGGPAPYFNLVVAGTAVHTGAETTVLRKGNTTDLYALNVLKVGQTIHVVGDRMPDGSIYARMLQIKGDVAGAAFTIEGPVGGLKGVCPSLTFRIKGFSISTDDSTVFTTPCESLQNGTTAKVDGTVNADGTIMADYVGWDSVVVTGDEEGDGESSGKGKGKNKKKDDDADDEEEEDDEVENEV